MARALFKYFLSLIVTASLCMTGYCQQRAVPDSVVKKMQQDRDFRYANDSTYWKQEVASQQNNFFERFITAFSRSAFLKIILYLILTAAILFTVYQVLVVNNFFTFSRRRKHREDKTTEDVENLLEHLDEKLADAIQSHNYRHAVRFLYLKTLRQLSESGVIVLNAKFTNKDYVAQLSSHNSGNAFTDLTKIYEYVWYGEFIPNDTQFDVIRKNFHEFSAKG